MTPSRKTKPGKPAPEHRSKPKLDVAVIGGGVSGLLSAYMLTRRGHRATVFEKAARVGGNMHSVYFEMDGRPRFADLAVNDFNAASYVHIVKLLDELGVPYRPLEDSTSYSTADGSFAYTQERPGGPPMPAALQAEYDRFSAEAPADALKHRYAGYTVERYLAEKGYSEAFGRHNLYPRINGMYFVHDLSPATMPFQAVMQYYILQEGLGHGAPRRMYFADGASSWADALAKACGASIETGVSVEVTAREHGVTVHHPGGDREFDAAVVACHASAALRLFRGGLTPEAASVLGAFDYYSSVGVAHTYARLLPADARAWAAYNISVREGEELRPYSINYVENRHQNDAANLRWDRYETQSFFVSLNPRVPIPERHVLRTLDGSPAVAYFPHNALTFGAMAAQDRLWESGVQGRNRVFFTGGWTLEAGLQEQCWHSAHKVARLLEGESVDTSEERYSLARGPEAYAPRHLRELVPG